MEDTPDVSWAPSPLKRGKAFAVAVQIRLVGLELVSGSLLAYWDNNRECVRTPDGLLRWYRDAERLAVRRGDRISVVERNERTVYPRGHYERAALMVRSLHDIADWTNVERIVSVSGDVIHLDGEEGSCLAVVTLSAETRVILNGSGLRPTPWSVKVETFRAINARHPALTPHDIDLLQPELD